jgi:hypothetical protein
LGNGAIVRRLSSGRSFFDGRARGEGSKGYVVRRDAHNNELGSGQQDYNEPRWDYREQPEDGVQNQLAAAIVFGLMVPATV